MTQVGYNTLLNIIRGDPAKKINVNELHGDHYRKRDEKWLESNKELSPDIKLEKWLLDNDDWINTPRLSQGSKDAYYNTLQDLAGKTKEQFEEHVIKTNREELDSHDSMAEKERSLRNKAGSLHPAALNDVQEYSTYINGYNDQKDIETARLAFREEHFVALDEFVPDFDPDIPVEEHTRNFVTARLHGFGEEIETRNGRVVIPDPNGEGGYSPVHAMPPPEVSPEYDLTTRLDLTDITRKHFKPILEEKRKRVEVSDAQTRSISLSRIARVSKDMQASVIVGAAMDKRDPILATRSAIDTIITKQIANNIFENSVDAIIILKDTYRDIESTLEGRMNYGVST